MATDRSDEQIGQHYGDHRIYLPPAVDFDCCAECNRRSSGYVSWPCEPALLMHRAERAEAAVQRVRADTLREAADEVQKEARWQIEQHYRNVFTYGEGILDRLDMLKRIFLDRAAALDGTPDGDSDE